MADDKRPDETPEERRKRRIEEARAKLKAQAAAPPEPPAEAAPPPAEETVEERRKRRIEEARAKLKAKDAAADAAPPAAAAPPADETAEERRKRRIEEARAKLKAKETAGNAPAAEAAPPSPAPEAKPAARKAKAGVEVEDASDDPLARLIGERVPGALESAVRMVGQRIVTVSASALPDVLRVLRDDEAARFDLLVDLTAVHRPEEEPPFEVVYQLCATSTCERLRVKARLADGQSIATATTVWPAANWLERECYDMFGIVFDGHPDLRRILLPVGWEGHPLRKEYPVEFRENRWVQENLNIVELPADADFTGKFEV